MANNIQYINLYLPATQFISLILIRWIVIYPVDSTITSNQG